DGAGLGPVAGAAVDEPVPGVEDAGPAAHPPPARDRLAGVRGLAVDGAVELEHRVAPDDDRLSRADGDVARLRAGEEQDLVGRARAGVGGGEEGRLVDVGDEDLGVDPGSAQGGETGRGRGGEDESHEPRAYGSPLRAAVTGVARAGRSTTGL